MGLMTPIKLARLEYFFQVCWGGGGGGGEGRGGVLHPLF